MTSISLKKIFSLSAIYGIAPILDRLISFVLLPILTHYLSSDEYGYVILLYAATNILTLLMFMGFPEVLSKHYWDHDGKERKEFFGTAWITTLMMNVLLGLPLIFFSEGVSGLVFQTEILAPLLVLIVAKVVISSQVTIPFVIFRAKEQKYLILFSSVLSIFIRAGLTILLLVYFQMGILGVLLADLLTSVMILLICSKALWTEISFTFKFSYFKEIMILAPYQLLTEILAWIINLSDRMIIQHILKLSSEVGIYSVGYTFGMGILFFVKPVFFAWRPYIYSIYSESPSLYEKKMGEFFIYYLMVACSGFAVIALLAPDLITLLTPDSYHRSISIVPIVLLGQLLALISDYFVPTFFVTGKVRVVTKIYAISAFLNIGLNLLFIPPFGIMGAAYTTLFSYLVMALLIYRESQKIRKIPLKKSSIFFLVAFPGGVLLLTSLFNFENPIISLTIKTCIIATILIFLVTVYLKKRALFEKVFS